MTCEKIKAPFPWFGGKSRAAHIVWSAFGDVKNYVEPFAGSLAVLLARPHSPHTETINDLDTYVSNFWRALQRDPNALADAVNWPVNEADLHARHLWLTQQTDFRERMKTDPDYYDVKIAGWWVWGLCQWIGTGWAIENGRRDDMRIALCGYAGDHEMPSDWREIPWKASGGYGSTRVDGTNENARRERIWLSPACLEVVL